MAPDPRHFDRDAELYEAVRPGYPPEVVEALRSWDMLPERASVLELGPGTGQATRQLLRAGVADLTAVELGPHLARVLQETVSDVRLTVLVGDANEVSLPSAGFDLAVAATSFHWFDPSRVLPRVADALRPGGHLAVWWNVFGDPAVQTSFRTRLDALIGAPRSTEPWQLDVQHRVEALTGTGLFTNPRHAVWRWSRTMTTEQTVALFRTFSDLADRPGLLEGIRTLVDELGGRIEDRYVTALYGVQKA